MPFNQRRLRVPGKERGTRYQGYTLGAREPSLMYHLIKRVVVEQQWARGTSAQQYLDDLHRAVRHPDARLVVYERGGDYVAATITPTAEILPLARRGTQFLPNLLVVYSANEGIIRTGYQFSDLSEVDIPEEARWLK